MEITNVLLNGKAVMKGDERRKTELYDEIVANYLQEKKRVIDMIFHTDVSGNIMDFIVCEY
jgi:hypothetical protein